MGSPGRAALSGRLLSVSRQCQLELVCFPTKAKAGSAVRVHIIR